MRRLMAANRHNCHSKNVRMNLVNRVGCVAYTFVLAPVRSILFKGLSFLSWLRAYSGIMRQPAFSFALYRNI